MTKIVNGKAVATLLTDPSIVVEKDVGGTVVEKDVVIA